MQSLTIVSNRLPVTVGKTIEKSSGGLVSALEGLGDKFDIRWIGWTGGVVEDPEKKRELASELKEKFDFTPIFLTEGEVENYYNGFSNSSLWPLLHYMPSNARYEERWFQEYEKVNGMFAEKVLEKSGPDDLVWIQDYHLMLLPAMLREARPDMTIGFFLHTPFPSYEIFRCHPKREQILRGLLGADLIGFHAFSYLRHFRSTVLRLLGIESELDHFPVETHRCAISVHPIGINAAKFRDFLGSPAFDRRLKALRKVYRRKKIVLSVERLDYSKGIPQRLEAIEMFLRETGRMDVVFLFISVPSRQSVAEYRDLRRDVELKVSQINGKHSAIGEVPVHFIFRSVKFEELAALYALADVAVVTPLIDGMNLVAKEFVFCQDGKAGALVLSEFAGAAQELAHAYIVNPYYIRQIYEAIARGLDADEEEKRRRLVPMKKRVAKYDARFWAESFIDALTSKCQKIACPARPSPLTPEIAGKIRGVRSAALFLDYDGTLADLESDPEDAYPSGEAKALLDKLAGQTEFDVYIASERGQAEMDRWFSGFNLNLIAENGYYCKEKNSDDWVLIAPAADLSWKDSLRDYLHLFTGMTPGSVLEEKDASLVWQYRNSDPDFGAWKAHQLVSELQEMLSNLPVQIHHGKKIVVIASAQANKGAAVSRFMAAKNYEAALCVGDDATDESMFRLADERIVGVKVGDGKETDADFRCSSPKALRAFLRELVSNVG